MPSITPKAAPEPEAGAEYEYQARDTTREGAWGHKPREPKPGEAPRAVEPRIGEWQVRMPRGWTQEVWDLRCALWSSARRLPRGTGLQALLEGAERWVKLTGKGRPGPGPARPESVAWWATAMALVDVVGRVADATTLALLHRWLARPTGPRSDEAGFRPFGTEGQHSSGK